MAGMGILLAAALTGCGDGTPDEIPENSVGVIEAVTITDAPVSTEPEPTSVPGVQLLYGSGELTSEEAGKIQEALETLHQNLEVPEYLGCGIAFRTCGL